MTRILAFVRKYKHAWLLLYAFIYLPWFCYLEKTVTRNFHVMHASLDDLIPFNEYFIVPYLLWFLYVGAAIFYFLITSKEDYYKLCIFLVSGLTVRLIICNFFRNGSDLRPVIDPDKNIFTALVAYIYRTDTCTNVFPSIHVYNSIGVHIAVARSERLRGHRLIRLGSGLLMISICMATVFLKQHSVIDLFGAVILAYVIYGIVYGYSWSAQDKKVTQKALG